MKKFNLVIIAILIAGLNLTLSSCKKYEDGPGFSLRTKKMRLIGQWDQKESVDSNGNTYEDTSSDYFEIQKNGTYKVISGSTTLSQKWEFGQHKSEFLIISTFNNATYTGVKTILRLTNKELWLKDEGGNISKCEKK